MRNIAFILILFNFTFCFGQQNYKVSHEDSSALVDTWTEFSNALLTKKLDLIKEKSLKNVYCLVCLDTLIDRYYVDIDTFIQYFSNLLQTTEEKSLIQSDSKEIFVTIYEDYQPPNFPIKRQEEFIIYNIGFKFNALINVTTDRQIETSGIHIFQFIKIKDKFVFYGFDILP